MSSFVGSLLLWEHVVISSHIAWAQLQDSTTLAGTMAAKARGSHAHAASAAVGALCMTAAGCYSTYAPPLQGAHAGAPARVSEGDVAVGAAVTGIAAAAIGGPSLSYGVRDWVAMEAGGNISHGSWGMGWVGPRFTYAPRRYAKNYFAADLHLATGAGWGGERCGNPQSESLPRPATADCVDADGRSSLDRIAGGGALGVGAAGHFSFFSVYGRVRSQLTAATHVPATYWGSGGAGVQFRIAHSVDLYAQGTAGGYVNRYDDGRFYLYELGVAVRFSTRNWRLGSGR